MKKLIYFLAIGAAFSSCQKVIDIDLNSQEPKIVIEGAVTDDTLNAQTITITKSVNFSQDNKFPDVSGASVMVADNMGNSYTFTEVRPGLYQNSLLHGVPGRTYTMTVVAEGKTFTATSTMPAKVLLDSLVLSATAFGPPGAQKKYVTPAYRDPVGRGNKYKFRFIDNGRQAKDLFIFDDDLIDGVVNTRPLFANDDEIKMAVNDTVTITMMCIDVPVFNYFFSLDQSSGGPSASASPANPVTNIKGATLGYFSAQTTETKKIIVR